MKALRLKVGWTGPIYKGTHDVAMVEDETYAAYIRNGDAEPLCTKDPVLQRHVLCQAAAELDVALTTTDRELDELAAHYGVRSTLKRKRG